MTEKVNLKMTKEPSDNIDNSVYINVKDFLIKGPVGDTETIPIHETFEKSLDPENTLRSFEGSIKLTLLEEEILAEFSVEYLAKTICARCLKRFDREGSLAFERAYLLGRRTAADGELIVGKDFQIEVGGPILEEINFDIPMKPLCKTDCQGFKK